MLAIDIIFEVKLKIFYSVKVADALNLTKQFFKLETLYLFSFEIF